MSTKTAPMTTIPIEKPSCKNILPSLYQLFTTESILFVISDRKSAQKAELPYRAVFAVRTRNSMACTGYCPAAVSPVSIRLDAPSNTAL